MHFAIPVTLSYVMAFLLKTDLADCRSSVRGRIPIRIQSLGCIIKNDDELEIRQEEIYLVSLSAYVTFDHFIKMHVKIRGENMF